MTDHEPEDAAARARQRARAYRERNKERLKAYKAQWRAANPDKVRAQQRASYARRKDAIAQRSREDRDRQPDKYAANLERAKLWRKNNPEKVAEYARERRKDPEKYAQQLHALREAAARANAARQRAGLPAADVATAISARAVERVLDDGARATALTSADIARAVQSVHAQMLREQKQHQEQSLRAALRLRVRRNTAALTREAEIENTARAQVGKARLPLDLAAHIIAFHQLKDQLPTDLLTQKDAARVIAHVREQNLSLFVEDTGPTRVGPELDGPTLTR